MDMAEQAVLERLQHLMEQAGPYLAEASELADRAGGPLSDKLSPALHRIRRESAEVVALIIEAKRGASVD
ncbi:TPA: hypothetical protein EYP12_05700 [Candidatus Bipolaricaulota bacterium]|nr:hypothetical protein [Candidatus Bipolaricaulota bacterium]